MKTIINKDEPLIKEYLDIREQIIRRINNDNLVDNYYREEIEQILDYSGLDTLIDAIDMSVSKDKMTDKIKELFTESRDVIEVVEYDYILASVNYKTYSFKSEKECYAQIDNIKKNVYYCSDYEPLESGDYQIVRIGEIGGTLEDNYDWIIDKYENGYQLFIKSDSVYEKNIKIAYI